VEKKIADLDRQINELKAQRDRLIKESGLEGDELRRILAFRTPKRTICQLLRELYDDTRGEQRRKVAQCLLIAKRMDAKLIEYAGRQYTKGWYDKQGKFND